MIVLQDIHAVLQVATSGGGVSSLGRVLSRWRGIPVPHRPWLVEYILLYLYPHEQNFRGGIYESSVGQSGFG